MSETYSQQKESVVILNLPTLRPRKVNRNEAADRMKTLEIPLVPKRKANTINLL